MAFAVPAKPGLKRTITLANGQTVTATLVGDEFGHFYRGTDGKAYNQVPGQLYYQEVNAESLKTKANTRRAKTNARRSQRMKAPSKVGTINPLSGDKKGLIILVNFKNKSFTASNSDFNKLANTVNYSSGNYKGSMYDYFYAQSDGQFRLTFDVVGPVTVSQNYAYYGGNDSDGNDEHPAEMVIEALKLADSQVNYADYDWNGDGEVEQVYIVYAGKGEADGGADDTIWPHEYDLNSAKYYGDGAGRQTLDGVKINTYACGGEQNGSTGATAGIGTMCHEFSHCLGYPDFYDTDYSGGQGMFEWDLMDSGSYNADGYRPAGYTGYERWMAGWKTPIELTSTTNITNMKGLTDGGNSYIIYNTGNSNEYFMLENRANVGWDQGVPGHGLLIVHVDYNASAWSNNKPNDDPSHQRMTWIPADNQYQYETYNSTKYYTTSGAANDVFPYGNVKSFGQNTTPKATWFNNNAEGNKWMEQTIANITKSSNGYISFNFQGLSNVAMPTFSPVAGRYTEAQYVTISCETAGATIYYTLDGSTPTTSNSVYTSPISITETTTVKAMAVLNNEQSAVATAVYKIGSAVSNPNTKTFRLVSSTDDLEDGLRYIIACGSKSMAAGALSSNILSNVQVNVTDDVITITDNVAVFVLEGDQTNGWTFKNESTNQYLYSSSAKSMAYNSTANTWTLSDGTLGVIMTYGDNGTLLYNSSSPRFTTYTSSPTTTMLQANLYVEDSSATPVTADPLIVADETVTFNTTVGTPQAKTFEVLSEGLTEDITVTLTTNPGNVFSLGSSTISKNDSELGTTGSVTFTPTAAGTYNGVITLTSAGADPVTISLSATATETGGSTSSSNDFELITNGSDFVEGDYILVYNNGALNTTVSSNRLQYTEVTPSNNIITTDDATIIWHIAPSGNYYTIYNAGENKYAASTGTKNQAQLLASGTDDKSLWSVTTGATFEFANKYNSGQNVNAYLRRNGDYGFACYAAQTGGQLSLYKRSSSTTSTKQDVTMSFSPASVTITYGNDVTEPTLTTDPDGLSVTYSSSASAVATVNASTGEVSVVGTGTTTITASFAGNDDYKAASASYVLTVNSSSPVSNDLGDYYASADGKMGEELKTAFFNIIKTHNNIGYDGLWAAYAKTDKRADGKLRDWYSNSTNYVIGGSAQGANYSKEGDSYNREHSVPQSWFSEATPMKADIVHVFPTDGYVNNRRSSYPFGEVGTPTYSSANGYSKLGPCTTSGYTGTVFEPNDEIKGDIARIYFYMATCYQDRILNWSGGLMTGNTYQPYSQWFFDMLLRWSKQDPVDDRETARNNAVWEVQKNRNPFVDFPGVEDYIWGDKKTESFSYDNYSGTTVYTVSTPVITPASGTYTESQTVTITCATDGATIYYTTDGSTPTISSTQYTASFVVLESTVITAKAFKDDGQSATATVSINIGTSGSGGGTQLLYETVNGYNSSSDSGTEFTTSSDYFDYSGWTSITKVYPGGTSNAYENGGCLKFGSSNYAGSMTASNITLSGAGTLTFYLKKYGNDTGKLNISVTGADADVTQFTPSSDWTKCTVNLTNGTGSVNITFATSANRAYLDEIKLEAGSSIAAPTFSPVAGIFNTAQSVTLACATNGATIHYTVDGSTPTASSATYSSAIAVNQTMTIAAIAVKDEKSSAVASATYILKPLTPTFSLTAGNYNATQSVTLSCTTEGATIHYTTDGSTPTSSSPTYSTAIPVSATTTIKAIAVKTGWADSDVATAAYTITLPQVATPTFSPAAGNITEATNVTISCTTEGATIHYTTDGTTPTSASATYTVAIPVSETTTIKAIAVKSGMTDSEIATATYTISSGSSGGTLLYESLSKYTSSGDADAEIGTEDNNLDYNGWTSFSKVYPGGTTNAYENGGCLKFGSKNSAGSMTASNITLSGAGTLTFYLKQYGSDSGKLNVTVTGADADVTQFTPSSSWEKCTVNLTNGTGSVSITLATSTKRAYLDEIKLEAGSSIAAPTFSPVAGTFNTAQSVTLACATNGATIHYTTDGSTPTASSATYSNAIDVNQTMTIKAIAVKGNNSSSVASASYTLKPQAPTFSVDEGSYTETQTVTLSCATAGTTIYYTTDGSDPTSSSNEYTGAITVDHTMTIKAIAVKTGWSNSDISSATYTIVLAEAPVFYIGNEVTTGGSFNAPQTITITSTTDGSVIYYTTNGDDLDPLGANGASLTNGHSVILTSSCTLKAVAVKGGYTSAQTSATFTISGGTARYERISSTDDLEDGEEYLIVCENDNLIFDGSLTTLDAEGNKYDVTIVTTGTVPYIASTTEIDNRTVTIDTYSTGNSTGKSIQTKSGYYIGCTTSNNGLTATNSKILNTISFDNTDAQILSNSRYLRYNNASTNGTRFRYYASNQQAIQLYKKVTTAASTLETITTTISSVGYSTLYYGDYNLTVPEGVEAYTYTITNGKPVKSKTYSSTVNTIIPAGEAVVIKADGGNYSFTVTTGDYSSQKDGNNNMKGSDVTATTSGDEGDIFYKLSLNSSQSTGSVGWYYGKAGGAAFTNGAHKAYLVVPSTQAAQMLSSGFPFSDETTGIDALNDERGTLNDAIYDLSGRRVNVQSSMFNGQLPKGIYVRNGKKIVVK